MQLKHAALRKLLCDILWALQVIAGSQQVGQNPMEPIHILMGMPHPQMTMGTRLEKSSPNQERCVLSCLPRLHCGSGVVSLQVEMKRPALSSGGSGIIAIQKDAAKCIQYVNSFLRGKPIDQLSISVSWGNWRVASCKTALANTSVIAHGAAKGDRVRMGVAQVRSGGTEPLLKAR